MKYIIMMFGDQSGMETQTESIVIKAREGVSPETYAP